ncbi:MAG: hypothetical protein IJI33_06250 [Solobacterium sp.]|nr:hypothetical protein [Solobacterium sp.]MBQ6532585.1 hypothetical protein [Solobacterium sp.]
MSRLSEAVRNLYKDTTRKNYSIFFVVVMDMNEEEEPVAVALEPDGSWRVSGDDHQNEYLTLYTDDGMIPEGVKTERVSMFRVMQKLFEDDRFNGLCFNPEQDIPVLVLRHDINTFLDLAAIRRKQLN